MVIVHEYQPGQFRRFAGGRVTKLVDGDPMPVVVAMGSLNKRSDEGLAVLGLYRVAPFVAPAGKVAIGQPTWRRVKGQVIEQRGVEDIPPPPPPMTAEEKLAAAGLSQQEFVALVTASLARRESKA